MDELVNDFEKLSKIISSNSNGLEHFDSLHKLVDGFYKKHLLDPLVCKKKEVAILSYILTKKIKSIYGRKIEAEN